MCFSYSSAQFMRSGLHLEEEVIAPSIGFYGSVNVYFFKMGKCKECTFDGIVQD